ncbi:ATP-binding cassette domain-containing protein [Actinomadura sp. ATCC 31491]|uniref:ATP-binding cassette domain-containing protein n=1 Tax=Actinomadura luzonensis TaxID=2805427 RepID=A0ABT0G272_9ACTN|nr:ATP-binding cassette domain-containing protein [Actinomadura luzonensis]MCK2218609.1 ATP-binding cassette domain-containing protein [Actinomadura luzonensis]
MRPGAEQSFGGARALSDVTVAVAEGEIVAVTGPSGAGKSTLLHCLAGIVRPESGEAVLDGRRLDTLAEDELTGVRRASFGIVFQFGELVPELTAAENVALPLMFDGRGRRRRRTRRRGGWTGWRSPAAPRSAWRRCARAADRGPPPGEGGGNGGGGVVRPEASCMVY